jgi:hypothetical protein
MKKWTVALGTSALIFALADLIHGQHNGDVHRFYIHIAEFLSFFGFLSLLEVQAFRLMTEKVGLGHWLAGLFLSLLSLFAGFALFALSGGSMHGDGGPLAWGFYLIWCIGTIGTPVTIIGFIVSLIMRKLNGSTVS